MVRRIYLSAFVILSAVAGLFYYSQTRLVPVVVATADLKVGSQVDDSQVTIRRVNAASLPARTLSSLDQAVGRFVSSGVLKDQFLDARQLSPARNAELLKGGLEVPSGSRIISIPVAPAAAVGGALKPGDLVDVIAIPNPLKSAGGVDELTVPEVIGRRVLVLGLRTDQGTDLDATPSKGLAFTTSKVASVLLAIGERDEARYSSALGSSTFFLALRTD